MKLRPRYSLLTLLILTALVAGGVKLWYGPHHVVEQLREYGEAEYSFTRDWLGNKTIHGPRVARFINKASSYRVVGVTYYRHGQELPWEYRLTEGLPTVLRPLSRIAPPSDNPLTPEEYTEFQRAVQREQQRPIPPGQQRYEYEQAALSQLNSEWHVPKK